MSELGQAMREAVSDRMVTREDLFVSAKLQDAKNKKTKVRPENVRSIVQMQLRELDLQYFDILLISMENIN